MSASDLPQIYLATPAQIELNSFQTQLAEVLDAIPVACLRLSLATRDEDALARAADVLRNAAHARDVPVVIDDHFRIAERTGLDGVHLTDGARRLRDVRQHLGREAIVGAYCGSSSHTGMTAGETGADYVSFGPVSQPALLDDRPLAEAELFEWWAEMIEVPVVAEGGLMGDALTSVMPHADFLCFGAEIWEGDHPPLATAQKIYADIQSIGA